MISPLLVDGQVHGGLAQGIGQALWEEVRLRRARASCITGSLMDYAVPRAFPPVSRPSTETPTPLNPLGAKGIGELPRSARRPPSSTP